MATYDEIGRTYATTRTLHHWQDVPARLAEVRRVSRRQVFLLFDNDAASGYWLVDDYFPELWDPAAVADEPTAASIGEHLDVQRVEVVPVPADCQDGFGGAFWARPEAHLRPEVMANVSWTSLVEPELLAERLDRLRADLESGEWDRRHGHLRSLPEKDFGYRLVVAGG